MGEEERPTFPWLAVVVAALALFGAISLLRFVVGVLFRIVGLLILIVVVVALVGWAMNQKTSRS